MGIHDVSLREAILQAAAGVFTELGYASARVEDILEAAGIARRTFYKYFKSKEDVLCAIYELATAELIGIIGSAGVDGALDAYLDYHVDRSDLLRVLQEEAMRSESPLAVHRQKFRADLIALLDAAVRLTSGEQHDPMFYTALISAAEGVSLELLSSKPTPKNVQRAKDVLHLIMERTLGSFAAIASSAPSRRPARSRR